MCPSSESFALTLSSTLLLASCGAGHPAPRVCSAEAVLELGLQEDVTAHAGCERAAGLRVRTGANVDLSGLTALHEVTGDIEIGPKVALDTVVLDGLVHVGGAIRVANNGSLRGLYLSRLERAGQIEVAGNPVLMTISLPRLAAVDGTFVIADNNALATVLVPALGRPANVRVENNPNLPSDALQ